MAIRFDHFLKFSADEVWDVLGTPDRVDWVPGVESCQFDGEVRSLNLPGAGDIKERILFHDSASRTIKYSCFESPGALESHHASMSILEDGQGSRLIWEARIAPKELESFVEESMRGSIVQLEKVLSNNQVSKAQSKG